VLPGTQHLQQIALSNEPAGELHWGKDIIDTPLGVSWPLDGMAAADEDSHHSSSIVNAAAASTSSSISSSGKQGVQAAFSTATPAAASSWRSSCRTLLAGRAFSSSRVAISDLAPLLGALQQLQTLYLHNVRVGDLDECGPFLKQLRALCMGGVDFEGDFALDTVAQLTTLRHLSMPYCEFEDEGDPPTIPAALTNLVHLTSLDLTHAAMTQDGLEVVCDISSVRQLDLSGFQVTTPAPSFDSLSRLVGLDTLLLNESWVGRLPEGMTALTGLRKLEWCYDSSNWDSVYFEPNLELVFSLPSLEHLAVSMGHKTSLPRHVSRLTALTELWVEGRMLTRLPATLVTLEGLERLTLYAEELRALPQGMAALSKLSYLASNAPGVLMRARRLPPTVQVVSLINGSDDSDSDEDEDDCPSSDDGVDAGEMEQQRKWWGLVLLVLVVMTAYIFGG
jgi:Leucine-rich repeat (LRR) protein